MSLITAILMLGTIIMIHELGHSLFAKLNGIGVIEFSLGMGSRLFSFEESGTWYSSKMLPSGGSCMMLGEDEGITDKSAFNNKSVWVRIFVVTVGPVSNLILAFGLPMVLTGITGYDTTRPAGVVDGYLAQAAGMEAGDVIKSINDRKVHSYKDINWYLLTHPQKSLEVTWKRTEEGGGTERFSTELEPVFSAENNQYMTGVQLSLAPSMVGNIGQSLVCSAYEVQYWIHYAFNTFYMMFHGTASVNDISGPVGIVSATDTTVGGTVFYGLSAVVLMLINFTTLLSANLGVMNLLSIPVLDGGRLMFLIMETTRGKPTDKEKEGMVHMAGMMVPLAPVVLTLFNDVRKLF